MASEQTKSPNCASHMRFGVSTAFAAASLRGSPKNVAPIALQYAAAASPPVSDNATSTTKPATLSAGTGAFTATNAAM